MIIKYKQSIGQACRTHVDYYKSYNSYGPKILKLILVKYTIFKTSKRKVSGELRIDRKVEGIGRGCCVGVFRKE